MLVLCFAFSGAGFPEQQVTKAIFNHPASRAQDSFLHTKAVEMTTLRSTGCIPSPSPPRPSSGRMEPPKPIIQLPKQGVSLTCLGDVSAGLNKGKGGAGRTVWCGPVRGGTGVNLLPTGRYGVVLTFPSVGRLL